jgi:hypothetical protein
VRRGKRGELPGQ